MLGMKEITQREKTQKNQEATDKSKGTLQEKRETITTKDKVRHKATSSKSRRQEWQYLFCGDGMGRQPNLHGGV